jgi:hypothetical protein
MSNPVVDWTIQQPSFNTTTEDTTEDTNSSIAVDSQGNSYIAYTTRGTVSGQTLTGEQDIAVIKLNTNGVFQWSIQQPTFNTDDDDFEPSIAVDSQGNSYIAYTTTGTVSGQTNTGLRDIAVIKLNTNGVFQWSIQQPTFNTDDDDFEPSIAVDSQGNSYIAYTTDATVSGQTNTGEQDIAVIKLNTNGVFQWSIQQPTFNTDEVDFQPSIAVDSQGNSYIAYTTAGTVSGQTLTGDHDIAVIKLNTNGVFQWSIQQPTFNTDDDDFEPSIAVDSQGNSYIAYTTFGTVSGQTLTGLIDIAVIKLNTNGVFQWSIQQPTFNTDDFDFIPSIAVDSQGNSYIAYTTRGTVSGQTNTGAYDIAVIKLNTDGVFQWSIQQPTFNTDDDDFQPSIAVDSQGNSYIAYTTFGTVSGQTNTGLRDIAVLKLSQNISPTPTPTPTPASQVNYKKYFVVDTSCQKSNYIMYNSLYQFYEWIVEYCSYKRFNRYISYRL